MISIDSTKCTNCGACQEECQDYVFGLVDGKMQVKYESQCAECGHCVIICPNKAIIHEKYPWKEIELLPAADIPEETMRNFLLGRRSIRFYKPDPVPEDAIKTLLEVAIHSGSSTNAQSEGFILLKDPKFLAELEDNVVDVLWGMGIKFLGKDEGFIINLLNKKYGPKYVKEVRSYYGIVTHRRENKEIRGMIFRNAPLILMMHGVKTNYNAASNCALAIRNIQLMAMTMGLGTCNCGFFTATFANNPKLFRKKLGLPPERDVFCTLMIGYPKYKYKYKLPRLPRDVKTF